MNRNYPIPAIILAELPGEQPVYEIIDGLQRLNAILTFIEGAFQSDEGLYFNIDSFPSALELQKTGAFPKLEPDASTHSTANSAKMLDYNMSIAVMRNASDEEINDVFGRINTYGHRLSNQERRQAGLSNDFTDTVRHLAASLRGDVSEEVLPLFAMPSISIDMPSNRHGYDVKADQVFWVKHGIINAAGLRESQDEECIADLVASMVLGEPVNRSRRSLDELYDQTTELAGKNAAGLVTYGVEKCRDEFKYIIGEIEKICEVGGYRPLKQRLFKKTQGNPFPTIFATLFLALHELSIKKGSRIADYAAVAQGIEEKGDKLDAGKKGATEDSRRDNINILKGAIADYFVVDKDIPASIYNNHTVVDIEDAIKRSQIELPFFELKQGLLPIVGASQDMQPMLEKIVQTACAIANNGPERIGKIVIGVCDKPKDAATVQEVSGVKARRVGSRFVVGINREATQTGLTVEAYIHKVRNYIENSGLSQDLKGALLANMDYHDYFGLGVLVLTIPAQSGVSSVGESVFFRKGDQTVKANSLAETLSIAKRFS